LEARKANGSLTLGKNESGRQQVLKDINVREKKRRKTWASGSRSIERKMSIFPSIQCSVSASQPLTKAILLRNFPAGMPG
jgi:hypothetical protein